MNSGGCLVPSLDFALTCSFSGVRGARFQSCITAFLKLTCTAAADKQNTFAFPQWT